MNPEECICSFGGLAEHTYTVPYLLQCDIHIHFFTIVTIILYFIHSWLCWLFLAFCGLSLVAVSRVYSLLQSMGFSLWWLLLFWSTGSRACRLEWLHHTGSGIVPCGFQSMGSVVVASDVCCSMARGIFPGQGSNLCALYRQPDSYPLLHWGRSHALLLTIFNIIPKLGQWQIMILCKMIQTSVLQLGTHQKIQIISSFSRYVFLLLLVCNLKTYI